MKKQSLDWAERAERFFRGNEFRSAALAFRASLLQTPSSAYLMTMFAEALSKVNPHSPFRHYAAKATMLEPGRDSAWLVLARGAFTQRELASSFNAIRRHILLAPESLAGALMLSRLQFHRAEYVPCLAGLGQAVVLAPTDKFVRMAQARCLFQLGRHGEALNASERAMKLGASLREYGFDHSRIARAAGARANADLLLDKLVDMDPEFARKRLILEHTITVDDLRPPRP
jgi:tetratricopeptide (TPR) repeat protein